VIGEVEATHMVSSDPIEPQRLEGAYDYRYFMTKS